MNKPILALFTILFLLSIPFIMGHETSVKASPKTWTVDEDGTEDFKTIQEAVNNAADGDTIFVHSGTYHEHVVVNKSVSLVGEDRDWTIIDGDENGTVISIKKAYNVIIKGFTVRGSSPDLPDSGISVDESSGSDISCNIITSNYDGIRLSSSSGNVVSGNIITSNFNGIRLSSSSGNVVSGNTITSNDDGISFYYYSCDNVVSGNTITSNDDGISFYYYSCDNVVSGNTITSNDDGIYLAFDSNSNTVYCNNFNNTHQVGGDSTNIWDDGSIGNYWSNYTGQDLNEDGIGDNPYIIDVRNQDNYPLMGLFSDFKVPSERGTYHVTTICNSTISDFRFEIGPETGNQIICFDVTGKDSTVGFCRVGFPTELMNYSLIVLVGVEEIGPKILDDVSNETYVYLYFTYIHGSHTIRIISSKTLYLYDDLLDKYDKLNLSYYELLNNYSIVLGNYSQLQESYGELNLDVYNLNLSYYELLNNYSIVLGNYSQLQESYRKLNNSYQEHLSVYSQNVCNIRNLMYIFAATTAIFIMTTIYLSKHAHAGKTKVFEGTEKQGTL